MIVNMNVNIVVEFKYMQMSDNLSEVDTVFVPAFVNENHWILIVVDNTGRRVTSFDSLALSIDRHAARQTVMNFFKYLQEGNGGGGRPSVNKWTMVAGSMENQGATLDCGILMMK